jgi:hypothetical protein
MSVLFHNSGLNLFLGSRKEAVANENKVIENSFLQQQFQLLVLFFGVTQKNNSDMNVSTITQT